MLSQDRLFKSGLIERCSLSDEHVRSMLGASVLSFDSYFPLFTFLSFPPLLFCSYRTPFSVSGSK